MQMTADGQITIPRHIQERLGITPGAEIGFAEENGRFYLTGKKVPDPEKNRFRRFRGVATVRMATDEIMALTRGEE